MFASVRFDTKTKEDIVFHEGATQADSYKMFTDHILEQTVDPSLGFDSSETGSDVLDALERFIGTNHPNVCGSLVVILMARNPNEVDISKIVTKVRAYRIQLRIAGRDRDQPFGGLHPETMYELAAKTNGFCAFSNWTSDASWALPDTLYFNAYFSSNHKVSGTGSMVLPPVIFTEGMSLYFGIAVQSRATAKSFQTFTISWTNTESGTSGTMTKSREQLDRWTESSMNYFQFRDFIEKIEPSAYEFKLEYSYFTEDTILIRINSDKPNDHWLPYQD
ncbi:hypothetical protein B9Z55_003404 [Caenorhabditis nigoni]|nr:hypothetical protein B9Z55_003404 [Caenorhabditis nigoni]